MDYDQGYLKVETMNLLKLYNSANCACIPVSKHDAN